MPEAGSSNRPTRVVLAGLVALIPGPGALLAEPAPVRVSAFLCDSAVHAIEFTDLIAGGESAEMARDRIGRTTVPDACGRYAGIARIASESVTVEGGRAYKVTAYRFEEDRVVAWRAETTFAPSDPAGWDL